MVWGLEDPRHVYWEKFYFYQFVADVVEARELKKEDVVEYLHEEWYDNTPLTFVMEGKAITKEDVKSIVVAVNKQLQMYGQPRESGLGLECGSVRFWRDGEGCSKLLDKYRDLFRRLFEGRAAIPI